MFLFFKTLWHSLLSFAFYYPLFMSYLWMIGAILFYWRNERKQGSYQQPTPLANTPPVSVLIPCYNEGDNAEETLTHALALDYPEFEQQVRAVVKPGTGYYVRSDTNAEDLPPF